MPVAPSSSCRERTAEFHSIVERLKRTNPGLANGGTDASSSSKTSTMLQFNKRGSEIARGIHSTSQKLETLTKLVKRTSMFDDPTIEIEELTNVIKKDIASLNENLSDLQHFRASSNEAAYRNRHSNDHSTTLVENLKSRLMDATKDFKDVLTLRTQSMKTHEERMKMYSRDGVRRFGKQPVNGSNSTEPLFNHRRRANAEGSSSGVMQSQMQQLVPVQDSFMQSRAEALRNIESTIAELGSIFTQLAEMVSEQGQVAIRIDENIEDAMHNMENAQGQLLKYLSSISSNRWLIIKIFFVLLIFLLVFVFFVA